MDDDFDPRPEPEGWQTDDELEAEWDRFQQWEQPWN